ncbi:uncharacterized protein LOC106157690 isoform X2 [Lingula anatina]|nr:uncharacterized protein LOC106157690 isoform X2 [Lingula anatina]XP_013388865.1 uncharacterized protein LOC106157690 isoform X2 [Lingula anatina]XP_013388866.1 uncharacterized protein LOC106157690 isoform X2 [Lingula anatina]|eukprot:XP_013388864.1 uncharacterized protein LOC106157690 isoform X2 [Lingula anatina]
MLRGGYNSLWLCRSSSEWCTDGIRRYLQRCLKKGNYEEEKTDLNYAEKKHNFSCVFEKKLACAQKGNFLPLKSSVTVKHNVPRSSDKVFIRMDSLYLKLSEKHGCRYSIEKEELRAAESIKGILRHNKDIETYSISQCKVSLSFGLWSLHPTTINLPFLRGTSRVSLYSPTCALHCGNVLYSGHNKWSKLKHTKPAADLAKSKKIVAYITKLEVACKEGGTDMNINPAIGRVLAEASTAQVPKEPLLKALDRIANKKSNETVLLEVVGPGACCLVLECWLQDNLQNTKSVIQRHLKKLGGRQSPSKFAFHRKGLVQVLRPVHDDFTLDAAEEIAIEVEAEEVSEDSDELGQDILEFICDPDSLSEVGASLRNQQYQVLSESIAFIPHTYRTLSGLELEAATKLVEKLLSLDFVINVFDNIEDADA